MARPSAAIRWRPPPATPCSTSFCRTGFLERVKGLAILFRQRLAEIKDRHPTVIAEVRGEGLLIGLRAVVPNGELVDALRAEELLTVAAGDNVVRLLPPLIVTEDEIAEAPSRGSIAPARRWSRKAAAAAKSGAAS